jgi:recombination protein U
VYGHYAEKSAVDYIGVVKPGTAVCFDCKETADLTKFPLANIHAHQVEYMRNVHGMGGYAFILVYFRRHGKHYRMGFEELYGCWRIYEGQAAGKRAAGTASIPIEKFKTEVVPEKGICLHYLKGLVEL